MELWIIIAITFAVLLVVGIILAVVFTLPSDDSEEESGEDQLPSVNIDDSAPDFMDDYKAEEEEELPPMEEDPMHFELESKVTTFSNGKIKTLMIDGRPVTAINNVPINDILILDLPPSFKEKLGLEDELPPMEEEPAPEPAAPWSMGTSEMGKAAWGDDSFAPFNFDCGSNHIVSLQGNSGDYLNSIGATCSDGTVFEPVGGSKGDSYKIQQLAGIHNIGVHYGGIVDGIVVGNKRAGGKGGTLEEIDCSKGPLTAIHGKASGNIIGSLGVTCKDLGLPAPRSLNMSIRGRTGFEKVRFYIVNDQGQKSDLLDAELALSKETTDMTYILPGNTVEFIIHYINDHGNRDVILYKLSVDEVDVKNNLTNAPIAHLPEKMETAKKGYFNWGGKYHFSI